MPETTLSISKTSAITSCIYFLFPSSILRSIKTKIRRTKAKKKIKGKRTMFSSGLPSAITDMIKIIKAMTPYKISILGFCTYPLDLPHICNHPHSSIIPFFHEVSQLLSITLIPIRKRIPFLFFTVSVCKPHT